MVAFLTDNTLGRIWYEMRRGDTTLKESCRYLVRRPSEVFLAPGEPAPQSKNDEADLTQEELHRHPVYIQHRPKKDPRDFKVLDPACGSGHFLLYAFELLEHIYEEAWADAESPTSGATGRTLREDYGSINELRRAAPKLIIEHNLHGIDIDQRTVQIAALALWLRAQKAWQGMGLKPTERPQVAHSNTVTAEPMPGEDDMRREFVDSLRPRVLGQLVDLVFERMTLAGEAGSLLKIEEEIKDGIAEARKQWLESSEGERQLLFPGMRHARPKQQTLRFDFSGIDNEQFWEEAESRILDALRAYAERAENGGLFRRRLFAEDAAHGFAFIDLCRKKYDVVLMNPPFGEFSTSIKSHSRALFPNTYNDIFAAFTERFFWLLTPPGLLGAITSRAGLFLTSFSRWRREFLLQHARLTCLADLGMGVMDEAMVEAASYCISRRTTSSECLWIRVLKDTEKETALTNSIDYLRFQKPRNVFFTDPHTFLTFPSSPFVYWLPSSVLKRLARFPSISPDVIDVKQGLATADDFRFARALWEVSSKELRCNFQTDGRWVPYVKGGSSQPWFSPITLAVNWAKDAAELYNNLNKQGKVRSNIWMLSDAIERFFFRPGFSWTRRAVRFIPYIVPSGCIPSASRYMAYPETEREYSTIGVCASNVATAYLRFFGERFLHPNYMVEVVKTLPWITPNQKLLVVLEEHVRAEVDRRRSVFRRREPFQEFSYPPNTTEQRRDDTLFEYRSLLGRDLDRQIADEYGIDESELVILERDFIEAVDALSVSSDEADFNNDESDSGIGLDRDETEQIREVILYSVGVIFGRWDVRMALDTSLAPALPNPFDSLPVCPPGMLVSPRGLPAETGNIVSEEWLRARPDARLLPLEGTVKQTTISDSDYLLQISWGGILVDDPGLDGDQPHQNDIQRRVRAALEVVWKDKAHEIEHKAGEILGVSGLHDYLQRPSGFFSDHLKLYSKSRRKAPIYWPLSTVSGAYTVWVYYHRLTEDTLYRIVSEYVSPKISQVEDRVAQREAEHSSAQGREAARLAKELAELTALLQELKELRAELLRVAHLPYRPNLNDGVQITAAPLWRLFRLPRWRSELERTWQALERGDYDWAHLAYAIWPERVQEKCRRDRSIAITHGLEEIYEERSAPERPARRRREQAS